MEGGEAKGSNAWRFGGLKDWRVGKYFATQKLSHFGLEDWREGGKRCKCLEDWRKGKMLCNSKIVKFSNLQETEMEQEKKKEKIKEKE